MRAAMQHVAERGYSGAKVRAIAENAGVTVGSLFYHFPTKADLVRSAFVEVVEPLLERTHEAARKQTGFVPAVVAWLEAGGPEPIMGRGRSDRC